MKILSTHQVKSDFDYVANLVKAGESIRVTEAGTPAFVIIPDNSDTEVLLRFFAKKQLVNRLNNAKPNAASQALKQQEVNHMIESCFE